MRRALPWLVLADLLDRTRRKGFAVAALAMALVATLYLPAAGASYETVTVGGLRGAYDSAWIGVVVAAMGSLIFSLPAFFLVRGSVARDEGTRFGEILAATPVSGVEYVLGKTFSNFLYLAALTGLVALSGAAIQLVRAEDLAVNPVQLLIPTVVIVWPAMMLVGAITVLFECVPLLRGGMGSVAYFALYLAVAIATVGVGIGRPSPDPLGVRFALAGISDATARSIGSDATPPQPNIGFNFAPSPVRTFDFPGLAFDAATLLGRLGWASSALLFVLVAALFFHRFDPARGGAGARLFPRGLSALTGRQARKTAPHPDEASAEGQPGADPARAGDPLLTALGRTPTAWRLASLIAAELGLMLKGRSFWWYAGFAVIVVAGALLPPENARAVVLPAAWLWPLLLWSPLGSRERRHGTAEVFFSAPRARTRGMFAGVIAGAIIALLASSGAMVNAALSGDLPGLLALCVGALFVPALAMACGALSGGTTLFEGLYLPLWYLGPLNKVAELDFAAAGTPGKTSAYLALSAALVVVALAARRRA